MALIIITLTIYLIIFSEIIVSYNKKGSCYSNGYSILPIISKDSVPDDTLNR